eukprot:COSAG01_NODE_6704_length_3536_cov_7.500145_1_plen_66_part_00
MMIMTRRWYLSQSKTVRLMAEAAALMCILVQRWFLRAWDRQPTLSGYGQANRKCGTLTTRGLAFP